MQKAMEKGKREIKHIFKLSSFSIIDEDVYLEGGRLINRCSINFIFVTVP